MDTLIFTTVCCGFVPRSAIESGTVAAPRMERIARCVLSSRYSIHDLSRCQGEGEQNLARFNMPLELGIAMGRSISAESSDDAHDWLVLVPQDHAYAKFASDLAGYDTRPYEGTVESIVPVVMSWLLTRPHAIVYSTPKKVLSALPSFKASLEQLEAEWAGEPPWIQKVIAACDAAVW